MIREKWDFYVKFAVVIIKLNNTTQHVYCCQYYELYLSFLSFVMRTLAVGLKLLHTNKKQTNIHTYIHI